MKRPHISYSELLEVVSWGIFSMDMKGVQVSDSRLKGYKLKAIDNAMYKGIYVGSPGKDIYLMLPFLDKEQMKEVAIKLSQHFPKFNYGKNANIAACVRFIYGQFEKQGVLKSNEDFKRMKKEKPDWSLPRKFFKLLYKELEKNDNFYGLTMLCEMEGHRLGDEAVINKDKKKIKEMENSYSRCIKYAYKCKSYKHMFSVYYWMGEYFKEIDDTDKAVKYFKLSIVNANKYYRKYFTQGDQYYSKRLLKSFKYIKINNREDWSKFKEKYNYGIKNKFKGC